MRVQTQLRQTALIRIKQARVRIRLRQRTAQPLIHIITGNQRRALQHRNPADPLRVQQSAHRTLTRKANGQCLKRLKNTRAPARIRTQSTLRQYPQAPVMPREHIQHQTRFRMRITVQNIRRLMQNLRACARAVAHDLIQRRRERRVERRNRQVFDWSHK